MECSDQFTSAELTTNNQDISWAVVMVQAVEQWLPVRAGRVHIPGQTLSLLVRTTLFSQAIVFFLMTVSWNGVILFPYFLFPIIIILWYQFTNKDKIKSKKRLGKAPLYKMSFLCRRIVALVNSREQKTTLLDFLQKKVQSSKSMINVFYAALDNATIVFFWKLHLVQKEN